MSPLIMSELTTTEGESWYEGFLLSLYFHTSRKFRSEISRDHSSSLSFLDQSTKNHSNILKKITTYYDLYARIAWFVFIAGLCVFHYHKRNNIEWATWRTMYWNVFGEDINRIPQTDNLCKPHVNQCTKHKHFHQIVPSF